MTWRTAVNNLATIIVSGVQSSYDLDVLPPALPAADLPALAPSFPKGGDFATLTYDGSVWRATLVVDHILYWAPAWNEAGLSVVLPDLMTTVDAYLGAIKADPTLGGVLAEELTLTTVQPGVMAFAGVQYFGVRFRHRWVRVVE